MADTPLGWEYESRHVMEVLENLRLLGDANLKATNDARTEMRLMENKINEMRLEFVRVEAKVAAQSEEIADLKRRLAIARQWLMGILAAIIIWAAQHFLPLLAAGVAPK